uniref:Uncharacterized protein n=1 Tax=Picea sitchensis TaxID=3332 RepID=B8LMD3_PICSI|nr:unknown [Picea sitchensis]
MPTSTSTSNSGINPGGFISWFQKIPTSNGFWEDEKQKERSFPSIGFYGEGSNQRKKLNLGPGGAVGWLRGWNWCGFSRGNGNRSFPLELSQNCHWIRGWLWCWHWLWIWTRVRNSLGSPTSSEIHQQAHCHQYLITGLTLIL